MRVSSEERSRVHERVDTLLDGGRPYLVRGVQFELIVYEKCMITADPPVDYHSRLRALNLEQEQVTRNYEKGEGRAYLTLVRRKGGEVDHEAH